MTRTAMALRMSAPAVIVALAAGVASSLVGAHADVTPRCNPERVWTDSLGQVIKRLGRQGRLTLYLREVKSGRVVEISRVSGTFTVKTAEGPIDRRTAWTHCFEYDDAGMLVAEIDCAGVAHRFEGGHSPKVNEQLGTAITGHKHIVAGRSTPTAMKVHYDERGSVERVERSGE